MQHSSSIVRRLPLSVRRLVRRIPGAFRLRDAMYGTPSVPGPAPGELRAVVYPPTWAHWDEMRQRPQFLLAAFAAEGHPVFFVDPSEPSPRVADGVHIVPSLSDAPADGVILYTHFAPVRSMFERFDDPVIIYDILDDLSIFDADERGLPEQRKVRTHHPAVMEQADVVMASAPALVALHRRERGDIVYVENGVDPQRFGSPAPVPTDIAGIAGPVVGYHGMVSHWFDFTLLATVAGDHPEWSFVLVGPWDPAVDDSVALLEALPNVLFLGPRGSDEIVGYVQAFDVGIVPFVVDDLTAAVSPLKMYEYLAAGVPVVATPLPVCQSQPFVETAATAVEFSAAIDRAIAASADLDLRMERRGAADQASWSTRLQPVIRRLGQDGLLRVPQ